MSMYIVLALCIIAALIWLFFRFYLPFGGTTANSLKARSSHFMSGKFVNQIPTAMGIRAADIVPLLRDQLRPRRDRRPPRPIVPERLDTATTFASKKPQITWFGHSTFLLQLGGKHILLDPIFSRSASPFQVLGPQRFSDTLPARIDELPHIDLVVISHDHYDHLDYASIKQLAGKTTMFFVPLGLAAHLRRWGVKDEQITELDWWEERTFDGIDLVCTPSRHFSGRTLTDRCATLWCSWVIKSGNTSVFFSGDGGYGPHFAQIGDAHGPFDLSLLECGQYDSRWADVHMMPEQTVQAYTDLKSKRMVPIHWGAFALALHSWTDPVERVIAAGKAVDATILTPKIGETVTFTSRQYPTEAWWEAYRQEG